MTIEIFEMELLDWHTGDARTTQVGVEQELIVRDVRTGGTVDLERLRTAVADCEFAPFVTFEPGGQLELSLPVDSSATTRRGRWSTPSPPCAARRPGRDRAVDEPSKPVPRFRGAWLPALRRHGASLRLDRPGRPGDDAPHRLDPGVPGLVAGCRRLEQYRVLQLAGPWIAAAFARQHRYGVAARDLARGRPGPHGLRRPTPRRRRPGRDLCPVRSAVAQGSPSST